MPEHASGRNTPAYRPQNDDGEESFRSQTAAEEAEALVLREFYRATIGRVWIRLSDFEGVTVDHGGRTEQIQLRDKRVRTNTSKIDWELLSGLRFLTVLDLSSNALTGKIPKALAGLFSLEALDLHKNQLNGTIPAELGQLPRLKRLRLSNNALSGSIPEEVGSMATLELFDCSDNELSGLQPAWACMATVHAEDSEPYPYQMYLFIMDAAPKSLRAVSAATRDEEARVRAVTWIQWHLDRVDLWAQEEEPRPQPRPRRRHLGDTQVMLVELPQHHRARVRFEVNANNGTSSFVVVGSGGQIPGTVFGAVTDDASSTSFDDFPHKVVEINGTSPEALETSSRTSGRGSNERQGRTGGATSVGAGVRSTNARVFGLATQEYHQLDVRHDGRVEPDGYDSAVISPPYTSFSLKQDDEFVDSWEEFVRRNGRWNNSFWSCVHNYGVVPLVLLVATLAFLSPLWALLFFRPLGYLLYALGVVVCALHLLVLGVALLQSLIASMLSCPGDVRPAALAVLRKIAFFILWAVACYCVVWFVVQNVVFVIAFGDYALVYIAVFAVLRLFACCGVGPASSRRGAAGTFPAQGEKLAVLTIAVEAADVALPPNWV